MQLSSQLLLRNESYFNDLSSLLLVNPPADDDLSFLGPEKILTFNYRVYRSHLEKLGDKISFGIDEGREQRYSAALIVVPKAKGELDLLLALATSKLSQNGEIYLVGENKGGVSSAAKKLKQFGRAVGKIDSAKHCQLWRVAVDESSIIQTGSPFVLDDWIEYYTLEGDDYSLQLATVPGVFSYGRLDEGSALLLEAMPSKLRGRILDFGCGSGVIGILAKTKHADIELEMTDINWLALECSKRSCIANQITAAIFASDGWNEVTGRVDGVLTNPPFHQGIATEYQTTERFIRTAKDKLTKHALLLVVANRFLKYPAVIEATFERCETVLETGKFSVYLARR